jgi:hypothetical protein
MATQVVFRQPAKTSICFTDKGCHLAALVVSGRRPNWQPAHPFK